MCHIYPPAAATTTTPTTTKSSWGAQQNNFYGTVMTYDTKDTYANGTMMVGRLQGKIIVVISTILLRNNGGEKYKLK